MKSDYVDNACDCCKRARLDRNDLWYCTSKQWDYFPNAYWAEDGGSECPSYVPDPDCFDDDDDFDDDDMPDTIDCPQCGGTAYYNGSEYECDECGWVGDL